MSGSKGGMFILAVGIFGAGYLAAPEVRTVTETKTDFVTVRIPDTHVVKDTKIIREDMPESCVKFSQELDSYRDLVTTYGDIMVSSIEPPLKEARKAIALGDIPGTIEPIEDLRDVQFDLAGRARSIVDLKSKLDVLQQECKADTSK